MSTHDPSQEDEKRRYKVLAFIDQYLQANKFSPTCQEISDALHISGKGDVHFHIEKMEALGWITSIKTPNGQRKTGTIHLTPLGMEQLNKADAPPFPDAPAPGAGDPQHSKHAKQILNVSYMVLSARISNQKAVLTVNIPILNLISASFGVEIHASDFSLSGLGEESYLSIYQDMLPARLKINELFALEVSGDSMINAEIKGGDYVIVKRTPLAENGDMCVVVIDESEATLKYFYKEEKGIRLVPANDALIPQFYGAGHRVVVQGKVVLVVRV